MTEPYRLAYGGRIDRTRTLRYTFDGIQMRGHPGDTLASALLAAGHVGIGRSIYRDRPRGVFAAGCTEPNALVQVHGEVTEPMLPATTVELHDGLVAESLPAIGRVDTTTRDAARFDKKYVHTDVLVIGGGRAGLEAALAAGRDGARVLLADEQPELGGSSLELPALPEEVTDAASRLRELPELRVLDRASAIGYYDHNYVLIAQRHRLWHVRAGEVVLATGAHERPIVFENNDLPGVMLASAARAYLNRYAVLPCSDAVVFTTSDSAYDTAFDLAAAGARIPAIVDSRQHPPDALTTAAREAGIDVVAGAAVVRARGQDRVTSVLVAPLDGGGAVAGEPREIPCDLLAVCGGWNPALQLFSQSGGQLRWDGEAAAFVAGQAKQRQRVVGAAAGHTGRQAPTRPLWIAPGLDGGPEQWHDHFVDLQRDATVADVWRAVDAGMRSVEHIKRYTTIGTGADQGKTSGINAVGVIAQALGAGSPSDVGTTTFRPPYTPVPFALLAGRDRGALHDPARTTPMHRWHVEHDAVFEDVGQWKRPRYYPRPGEDMDAAVLRECAAARTGVAMQDVSTLGRIEVVGTDAPEFLNRVYTNGFAKLAVGKARYGMMCKADGMVLDDGVCMRLAEDRYLMSTTTGGAAGVLDWLEEWLQTEWPELDVYLTSVTEQWAAVAVVGPDARTVVSRVAPGLDCSAEAFGFMEVRETTLRDGVAARICRVSFSGELAYEINVASWYGAALWEDVVAAGEDLGITPYGTETMHVLRAEKGFVIVGQDTDGTVTPGDLGMDWIISKRKDFIGKRSFSRADTARADRKHLVGLLPVDPDTLLPEGAQLVAPGTPDRVPVPMLGHVTSSYRSAALERCFALALVARGRERIGEVLHAPVDGQTVPARVTKPIFYDEEGARRDGR